MNDIPEHLREIVDRLELPKHRAPAIPDSAAADDPALADLTAIPFVTIDNEDSRDLDQALYVERTEQGFLVRYAIADASYFVRPGTELFQHALERGTSFYFPGFALPMLPRPLSEGIVSLNEGVERRALVFDSELLADGEIVGTSITRARIRSRKKLSYDGVQHWFDEGAKGDAPWAASLRALRDVGEIRARRAADRGVIEFDRTETAIHYDAATSQYVLGVRIRNDVERWNEQLSLLCNTEGARLMRESDAQLDELQTIYRVHLPPLESRLEELQSEISELVDRHGLGDEWDWDRITPLADYLRDLPHEPWRVRKAIELQVRYTNRASEYTDRVGPHFALAVDQYARFSAPMREVVGIFTHKEALEALELEPSGDEEADVAIRAKVIEAANHAKTLQKRIDKEVMLRAINDLMKSETERPLNARSWRNGTVIGVRKSRVYVLLDDLPLDLKLYVDDLEETFGGPYDLRAHVLVGPDDAPSFGLGDGISIRVHAYDEGRRRYQFDVREA